MNMEYEVKFYIDVEKVYQRLHELKARVFQKNRLMKRWVFTYNDKQDQWLRVRDEGERVTVTLKLFNGNQDINSVKEVEITVSDFNRAYTIFSMLNFDNSRYLENYREVWTFDDCYLMIDRYPGLDPFIEIEGSSENDVLRVVKKLNIDFDKAMYGPTALLYQKKYNISREMFESIDELTFDKNPFEG